MQSPVRNFIITSDYGIKRKLPDGRTDTHDGIDYVSETNNRKVYAVSNGFVVYDYDDYNEIKRYKSPNTGGNMVIITSVINNKTYHIRYLHLLNNNITKGQLITEGMLIGEYGDVGYSFGAHLHLDVYTANWNKKINPHDLGL